MDAMDETNIIRNDTDGSVLITLLESQSARFARIIKVLLVCWAVSMVLMGSLFVCLINSATEEETTTEVAKEADNYGSNVFTHGDYYGNEANGQDN